MVPGTRIPITIVLAYARDSGDDYVKHLLEDFPTLDEQGIKYAIDIAIKKLKEG